MIKHILDFILFSFSWSVTGILDFTSTDNISLEAIVKILKAKPEYGNYKFETPLISNKKLIKYNDNYNKTSKEVFNQFLEQI